MVIHFVIAMSDSVGRVVEKYQYAVYGNPLILNQNNKQLTESKYGNSYMFTGRRFDTETRLYYYRARYYSTEIGRFLQVDPIGYETSTNLYLYCYNNPINYSDNDGRAANLVAGGIGSLVGGIIGGASYAIFHKGEWNWSQFIGSTAGGAVTGGLAGLTLGTSLVVSTGGAVAVGAGSSASGYVAEWGTSQGVTGIFGEDQIGDAKEWSTYEFAGATALGALTAGVQTKFNYTSHVRGRWPTTLKTSLVGKHAQALYRDAAISGGSTVIGYEAGKYLFQPESFIYPGFNDIPVK